jgi:hypothetical protein
VGEWVDGEMERWENGGMDRWRDGQMEGGFFCVILAVLPNPAPPLIAAFLSPDSTLNILTTYLASYLPGSKPLM